MATICDGAEAPPRIVSIIGDLLFVSRIGETARTLGAAYKNARTLEQFRSRFSSETRAVLLDLTFAPTAFEVLDELARCERGDIAVVGFFPHVAPEAGARAHAYGFVRALTRSKFVAELEGIVRGAAQTRAG